MELLATFGNSWQLLATFGNFRHLLALLATLGNFWQLLATFGNFWQLLATDCCCCCYFCCCCSPLSYFSSPFVGVYRSFLLQERQERAFAILLMFCLGLYVPLRLKITSALFHHFVFSNDPFYKDKRACHTFTRSEHYPVKTN